MKQEQVLISPENSPNHRALYPIENVSQVPPPVFLRPHFREENSSESNNGRDRARFEIERAAVGLFFCPVSSHILLASTLNSPRSEEGW